MIGGNDVLVRASLFRPFAAEGDIIATLGLPPGHRGCSRIAVLDGFRRSGRLRLDDGTTGSEAVTVSPGDFIHVPPGLVHRDVNPDRARGLIVVNILVGSGVRVVNVDRP